MTQSTKPVSFITGYTDHRGDPNGGFINLNAGYATLPAANYVIGNFSIAVWVYPGTTNANSTRIVEFGNGTPSNNIILYLCENNATDYYPAFYVYKSTSYAFVRSSVSLKTSKWSHIVATFTSASQMNIYINGVLAGTSTVSFTLPTVTRSYNYLGSSKWGETPSYAFIDDIRIYGINSLSQSDVTTLYTYF